MEQLQRILPHYFENQNSDMPFDIQTIRFIDEHEVFHREHRFMIVWITKGNGNYCIDQQKHVVSGNQMLFIKPGHVKALQLAGAMEGYVISFTGSFFNVEDRDPESIYEGLYQLFSITQGIIVSPESMEDIQDIMEIMMKEFSKHNLYRSEILKRYFKIFLIYLSRQFNAPEQNFRRSRNEEILQSFMHLLEKNFRAQKMVAWYASRLSVTPNYLNEVIKKVTGNPAGHHIRQRIALEAKRQAAYSNICMKKIAYDLGFDDMAHFSKFFKNTTGVNFSDFKRKGLVLQPVL